MSARYIFVTGGVVSSLGKGVNVGHGDARDAARICVGILAGRILPWILARRVLAAVRILVRRILSRRILPTSRVLRGGKHAAQKNRGRGNYRRMERAPHHRNASWKHSIRILPRRILPTSRVLRG